MQQTLALHVRSDSGVQVNDKAWFNSRNQDFDCPFRSLFHSNFRFFKGDFRFGPEREGPSSCNFCEADWAGR